MKTGLVLEGGALRTIYSCGALDAFLDGGLPLPDYVAGVSAGAAYGCSFLSRQTRRNLKLVMRYSQDPRYMGMRNLVDPGNRSYFGLKFAYDTIPNELLPFDYDAFEAYPGTVEAVLTNLNTGAAEYVPIPRRDRENIVLQATCAIPLMFPPIEVNGASYFDGGCADPIPWRHALEVGCDRVLVLLTRERDYEKKPDNVRAMEAMFHKHPAFLDTMRRRADAYNDCRADLFAAEAAGDVMVLAPEDTFGCSRTERDLDKLLKLWQEGYFAARRVLGAVRSFWGMEEAGAAAVSSGAETVPPEAEAQPEAVPPETAMPETVGPETDRPETNKPEAAESNAPSETAEPDAPPEADKTE